MRARVFNIMQYERHPETGELLINEDQIKVALAHKSIKQWAYVAHNRDVYSLRDEADNPDHRHGDLKPKHWHIVCRCDRAVEVSVVAKWFTIRDNFVDVPKGQGAFLDCCQYLTHEDIKQQQAGKRLYEDDEVRASFDFRGELDARAEKRLKYGTDLDPRDQLRHDVMYGGMTLIAANEKDPLQYMADFSYLKKCRLEYLGRQKPPKNRINYYVTGKGGDGKGLISRAIARALYPGLEDDEVFFETGEKGALFEGYDGQPVVIWNDRRAYDLLTELGGRANVFNVFDSHPTKGRQNIKYGSVCLINEVNIVNSVQPYAEFLDGLAGAYKDKAGHLVESEITKKEQSYRRFPIIIPLHEDDFEIMLNAGFLDAKESFEQYVEFARIRGNFRQLYGALSGNQKRLVRIENGMAVPVVEAHRTIEASIERVDSNEDLIDIDSFGQVTYGVGFGHGSNQIPGQMSLRIEPGDEIHE